MLKVKNLKKYYGTEIVLNNVSFNLEIQNKVALVGYNGTGKSTLLKILSSEESPDSGQIVFHSNRTVGFVPQETEKYNNQNVLKYIEKYVGQNDDSFYRNIEIMFAGFALPPETKSKNIGDLSSGQKTKIFLTAILLKKPDLMLLDEPTNNLDLPALIWLEDFLKNTDSAFIVVSHDKKFLNNVCNKIFEIDWHDRDLKISNAKYLDFLIEKEKQQKRQMQLYDEQREERNRLRNSAMAKQEKAEKGLKYVAKDNDKMLRGYYRDKATDSFRDAKIIYSRIKRMEKIRRPSERGEFKIKINPEISPKDLNISISELICGYDDKKGRFKIGPINLDVFFGNRICILGLNGSGKTTFLKTFLSIVPKISGEIKIGSGVKFGNLMQEHESLPKNETAIGFLTKRIDEERSVLQNTLLHFGFDEVQVKTKIAKLSPGGRARLLLAYFSALNVNTLILDEPTNHLDMEAQEALDVALEEFQGTIITVTHDRFFVEKARHDFLYVLENGDMKKISNFKEYVEEMQKRSKKLLRMLIFK